MKYLLDIPRTAMEVFNMLPEGTLCEVIDNTLYMSPSPTTDHQKLLVKFSSKIATFCDDNDSGAVFVAPCDVYLDNGQSVVQPDILFISKERENIIQKNGIVGSPNVVIEILSTNRKHDQEHKLKLYERNNIHEYIIVDPETKEIWYYLLHNGSYTEYPTQAGQLYIQTVDLTIAF